MKTTILALLFLAGQAFSQTEVLPYNEYLGYVIQYHPLVKTANLRVSSAQAGLMMARGGFDPKIEVDFEQKKFKDTPYYSLLNSSFKIPAWYGIEVKAGFEDNRGLYLNPEHNTPNQGLAGLGITVPLGQGLLINQRMADLRKAKIQLNANQAERKLLAAEVLYEASKAYFDWKINFDQVRLYEKYAANAQIRYKGIASLITAGDKPAIDSIEAGITVSNRRLNLEEARLKLAKSRLLLSNFLWLENVPVELQETMQPEKNLTASIKETLQTIELLDAGLQLNQHPKIISLESKIALLDLERKLKANQLLPKIDLGYTYLSQPNYFDNSRFNDYKFGVNFSFPLFLRKERGGLQLTRLKLQEAHLDLELERLSLSNKIKAQQTEIRSLEQQQALAAGLVKSNQLMLDSEERLFGFGESSVFLINTRENNLISAQLNQLAIENRFLESNAALFKIRANTDSISLN